jgi:hypothetical protein
MLRVPQHERKVLNEIKAPPFVLSIVEGLRQNFSAASHAKHVLSEVEGDAKGKLEGSRLGLEDGAVKRRSLVNRNGRNFVAAVSVSLLGCLIPVGAAHTADAKPSWQVTWENTVAAAKKEGRLNFYVGRYGSEPLLNEFRKEFPEIKIFSTNGTGNSLGTRIVAEARAGNMLADLYSGGAVTNFEILYKGKVLDSLKSALVLPEVLDESKWYGGKYCYNDPEQQHIFIYLANPTSTSIYFNTNLVNPKDFKSYWDLVNSKWKGKYVSQEPTSTGIGPSLQFFFYHPEIGSDFLRKLFIDMQPVYSRDRRQMTDWLAQGKFALCLGCRDSDRARKQGLPVDDMDMVDWKEGLPISPGAVRSVLSRAGRIPMPPRFSSTGSCRARARSRCKNTMISLLSKIVF